MSTLEKLMAKRCEHCPLCRHARANPDTAFGRIMHWHGKWCPFWKAWQKEYNTSDGKDGNRRMSK